MFAARFFPAGELVLKAQGIRSTERTPHTLQIGANDHLFVDPPVRYINHSCEPNMGVKSNEQGLIDFVAMRDIEEGEELCFDYAMTEDSLHELESESTERIVCACGAPTCRGEIGHYASLPHEVKARYQGFIADHLMEEC